METQRTLFDETCRRVREMTRLTFDHFELWNAYQKVRLQYGPLDDDHITALHTYNELLDARTKWYDRVE